MLWLNAWRLFVRTKTPAARVQQRLCSTKPPNKDPGQSSIDYSKHPAYKDYTFWESAEIMMQETDKPPTLVHRWDWHFWHFLVSLIPAGMTYLGVLYIRGMMVEDARSQGLDVKDFADLQAKMPRHRGRETDEKPTWWRLQQVDELQEQVKALQSQMQELTSKIPTQQPSSETTSEATDEAVKPAGQPPGQPVQPANQPTGQTLVNAGSQHEQATKNGGWVSAAGGAAWNAAAGSWRWVCGRVLSTQKDLPGRGEDQSEKHNAGHVDEAKR